MKDSSEGMTFLLKRWYHLNKEEVDMKVQLRKEEEDREKARILEEARYDKWGDGRHLLSTPSKQQQQQNLQIMKTSLNCRLLLMI